MATVKHTKVSTVPDGDDATQVQPSDWNADHEITLSGSGLVGKSTVGSGSAQEISLGSGLVFNASSIDVQVKTVNGESLVGVGDLDLVTQAEFDTTIGDIGAALDSINGTA